ncbi:hypothetical protein A2Z00_04375 [Candidatus Gottesmanbacteria bacterium RBG_13_45_10]|uniref:Uncharacterized protein n=1 Tax=Candidatus Gottesmanbacteria bacterium RBG_13_45_10 TaxID=1798370 RepID=A0A1F5ZHD0_9BACT|nr:MAG: hypothetical protein A2Z00_04375 [Candidatus Gottesmanbacteria bacterium RBG_13_45_10]
MELYIRIYFMKSTFLHFIIFLAILSLGLRFFIKKVPLFQKFSAENPQKTPKSRQTRQKSH